MTSGRAFSDDDKQSFLDTLARTGVILDACTAIGCSRSTVTLWRNDPQFNEAYEQALLDAADGLESEARRRAVEGVVRVRFDKAGNAYDEITYSDPLLLALLKARKPHEFAERSKSEISGPEGKPIETNDMSAAVRLASLLEEARVRRAQAEDDLFS